jgi:hypothetical protein
VDNGQIEVGVEMKFLVEIDVSPMDIDMDGKEAVTADIMRSIIEGAVSFYIEEHYQDLSDKTIPHYLAINKLIIEPVE